MAQQLGCVALLVRDHAAMTARAVTFCGRPREEAYGTAAVFADLYGNRWDLIQPCAV